LSYFKDNWPQLLTRFKSHWIHIRSPLLHSVMINVDRTMIRKVLYKFLEPLYMQGSNPLDPTLSILNISIRLFWVLSSKQYWIRIVNNAHPDAFGPLDYSLFLFVEKKIDECFNFNFTENDSFWYFDIFSILTLEESRVSLPKQLDAKNIDIKILLLIDWNKLSQYWS